MTATKEKHKETLPHSHRLVASTLREGKQNATLKSDIMSITGIKDSRQMYQIIEDLIIDHGYCIAGSKSGEHKGYYLITNKKELQETLRTINATAQSLLNRHKQLQKNYIKLYE